MNVQTTLLKLINQLRVFHWQTESYARHMAFGGSYDALAPLVDEFIETYIGAYGRMPAENIEVVDINKLGPNQFCNDAIMAVKEIKSKVEEYPDLANMADEIIGVFGKLKYLLTLK